MSQDSRENFGVNTQISTGAWRGRAVGGERRGDWLVCCFGFNGPLRQYFSLYRAVFQRE